MDFPQKYLKSDLTIFLNIHNNHGCPGVVVLTLCEHYDWPYSSFSSHWFLALMWAHHLVSISPGLRPSIVLQINMIFVSKFEPKMGDATLWRCDTTMWHCGVVTWKCDIVAEDQWHCDCCSFCLAPRSAAVTSDEGEERNSKKYTQTILDYYISATSLALGISTQRKGILSDDELLSFFNYVS